MNIWPKRQLVSLESATVIFCDSVQETIWIFHNRQLMSNTTTLLIRTINFSDAGLYYCHGRKRSGRSFVAVSRVLIIGVKI